MIDAFYPLLWAYKQVFESSNHIFVNLILHLGGPKNLNFAHQHCFKREIPLLGISPKAFEKVKKGLGMRKICQEFSRQKCIKFWMRLRFASSGANHQKIILCNVYEKTICDLQSMTIISRNCINVQKNVLASSNFLRSLLLTLRACCFLSSTSV